MRTTYDQVVHQLEKMSLDEMRSLMEMLRSQLRSENGPDTTKAKQAHLAEGDAAQACIVAADAATSATVRHTEALKAANGKIAPFGWAKGRIVISDDFDAPLDDFREYMQ